MSSTFYVVHFSCKNCFLRLFYNKQVVLRKCINCWKIYQSILNYVTVSKIRHFRVKINILSELYFLSERPRNLPEIFVNPQSSYLTGSSAPFYYLPTHITRTVPANTIFLAG